MGGTGSQMARPTRPPGESAPPAARPVPPGLRAAAPPAGPPDAPPDKQDDRPDDGHSDQQVEGLEGVADVDPAGSKLDPGEDEEHRPQERAGRRVDDERPERHPGDARREADEGPHDRQEAAEE